MLPPSAGMPGSAVAAWLAWTGFGTRGMRTNGITRQTTGCVLALAGFYMYLPCEQVRYWFVTRGGVHQRGLVFEY